MLDRQTISTPRWYGNVRLGLCDPMLDQQNLCKTASLNHPIIKQKQCGQIYQKKNNVTQKWFQQKSVSKFHPEIR